LADSSLLFNSWEAANFLSQYLLTAHTVFSCSLTLLQFWSIFSPNCGAGCKVNQLWSNYNEFVTILVFACLNWLLFHYILLKFCLLSIGNLSLVSLVYQTRMVHTPPCTLWDSTQTLASRRLIYTFIQT
jgi:hypothetical protein